jgi:hypothetical protein
VISRSELVNLKKKVHFATGMSFAAEIKADSGNSSLDMRYSAVA